MPTTKRQLRQILREARDLLDHAASGTKAHIKQTDGSYPPCAACDLEARLDDVLDD